MRMARALLVFGSAILYGLAFPPYDYWPLLGFALVPLLCTLRKCQGPTRALFCGAAWALIMTFVVGHCLVPAAELFYGRSALAGWILLTGAGIITAAPQYAGFAVIYWFLAKHWRAGLPLLGGTAWAGAEWARTALPPGNPWAISGYALIDFPAAVQIADLGGTPAVSFVVASVNIAIALAWEERTKPAAGKRAPLLGALSSAAVVAGSLVYGSWHLGTVAQPKPQSPKLSVAAIQPGGGPRLGARPEAGRASLVRSLELSSEAIENFSPEVVFWPESSLAFYPEQDALYRRSLPASLPAPIPEIVAGGPRILPSGGVANAVFVIAPHGDITSSYDKEVLLPFGESFPAGMDGLIQRDLGGGPRTYVEGVRHGLLDTALGQAGVAICNETMIPSLIRERVALGASFLVNPTNDAWFPNHTCPLGLLKIARLRAIEERRWLIRVSSSGPSAIIDPTGRMVAHTEPGESTWIAGRIEPTEGRTLYNRTRGFFGLLCLLVALVGAFTGPRIRRGGALFGS